jgi:hypothetical protein
LLLWESLRLPQDLTVQYLLHVAGCHTLNCGLEISPTRLNTECIQGESRTVSLSAINFTPTTETAEVPSLHLMRQCDIRKQNIY